MAKQRYINTKLWRDSYIESLDPSEKLVFIYMLTNPDTNISGIYEIPLKIICADTGYNKDMVEKIFERFQKDGKILYKNGWLAIKNFIKHQTLNPKVQKGIEIELEKAPKEMVNFINGIKYDRLSIDNDSLSHINSNTNSNINLNINTNTNTNSDNDNVLDQDFLDFWIMYDKKENQNRCIKLWSKLTKAEKETIAVHLPEYVKSTPDKQFRKHPATYLNQKSFNDEIVQPFSKAEQKSSKMVTVPNWETI